VAEDREFHYWLIAYALISTRINDWMECEQRVFFGFFPVYLVGTPCLRFWRGGKARTPPRPTLALAFLPVIPVRESASRTRRSSTNYT
jgi:hypothetical protein